MKVGEAGLVNEADVAFALCNMLLRKGLACRSMAFDARLS